MALQTLEVIGVLLHHYNIAVEEFENLSQAVREAVAADEIPSADLLNAEDEAREAVLATRQSLLAELEIRGAEIRSGR